MEVTSIVLAGGKSLRLGKSKALEIAAGKSLIARVIQQLKQLSSHVLIATSREQSDLLAAIDAEILVDIYPNKGPLGGIYTGLMASQCSHNIVVACDMPFLNTELLHYMVELSRDFDAVVPRLSRRHLEPLHAVYSKACLDSIRKQLDSGQLRVGSFLSQVRVRYIERPECQRLDPQLLSFFNINYQSDLNRAIALATEQEP
jgi:molybdopterin-guanine dinucleotide biosynthesis protein A